jgi:hypothetical protein
VNPIRKIVQPALSPCCLLAGAFQFNSPFLFTYFVTSITAFKETVLFVYSMGAAPSALNSLLVFFSQSLNFTVFFNNDGKAITAISL